MRKKWLLGAYITEKETGIVNKVFFVKKQKLTTSPFRLRLEWRGGGEKRKSQNVVEKSRK